jgi:hypothetical protein
VLRFGLLACAQKPLPCLTSCTLSKASGPEHFRRDVPKQTYRDKSQASYPRSREKASLEMGSDKNQCPTLCFLTSSDQGVRYGSLADIMARSRHVRFTPDTGHS